MEPRTVHKCFLFFQVDATVLQLENQKLVQQLDLQKKRMYDVETRIQELHLNQTSYDDQLVSVNRLWNQVRSCLRETNCTII